MTLGSLGNPILKVSIVGNLLFVAGQQVILGLPVKT
jgi:hypothetical protein